jgi:hypothetical protein
MVPGLGTRQKKRIVAEQIAVSKKDIGLLTYKQPDELCVFVIESGQFHRFHTLFFDYGVGVIAGITGNGAGLTIHGVGLRVQGVGLTTGVGLPTNGVGLAGVFHGVGVTATGVGLAVAVDGVGVKCGVGLATNVPGNGVRVAGMYAVGVGV